MLVDRWGNVWLKRKSLLVEEGWIYQNQADVISTRCIEHHSATQSTVTPAGPGPVCTPPLQNNAVLSQRYNNKNLNCTSRYKMQIKNKDKQTSVEDFCFLILEFNLGLTESYLFWQQFTFWRDHLREARQREAAAVIYLRQLLFNNAPVLQSDWLLFGDIWCQHLLCRAQLVAEK